jgi:type II restriction enzyme
LRRIFDEDGVKNLVDYVLGVEAGVDSNGRKNRGGSAMEKLVEDFVAQSCQESGLDYLSEATPAAASREWGITTLESFEGRRFDFVIRNGPRLIPIETNFYGAGGSKLKSVAGEFIELEQRVKSRNLELVWITDGPGWLTTKGPLKTAYLAMDFVMNIELMQQGMLRDILKLS